MTFIKCSKEITLISSGRQLTRGEECDSKAGWLRLVSCGRLSGLRRVKLTVNQGRGGKGIHSEWRRRTHWPPVLISEKRYPLLYHPLAQQRFRSGHVSLGGMF